MAADRLWVHVQQRHNIITILAEVSKIWISMSVLHESNENSENTEYSTMAYNIVPHVYYMFIE